MADTTEQAQALHDLARLIAAHDGTRISVDVQGLSHGPDRDDDTAESICTALMAASADPPVIEFFRLLDNDWAVVVAMLAGGVKVNVFVSTEVGETIAKATTGVTS